MSLISTLVRLIMAIRMTGTSFRHSRKDIRNRRQFVRIESSGQSRSMLRSASRKGLPLPRVGVYAL